MSVFRLPDLGEGLPDAEIHAWHVAPGETVAVDQPLVSMETAKAIVEVPAPVSGKVVKVFGQPGETIKTGDSLVEFDVEISEGTGQRKSTAVAGNLEENDNLIQETAHTKQTKKNISQTNQAIKALPMVRAFAKKLNIDLSVVNPTGPNQTITKADVENASKQKNIPEGFSAITGVLKAMSESMAKAHAEVVPVTVVEDVNWWHWTPEIDITVKLIQAISYACQKEPSLNAWFDGHAKAKRVFKEVHLGLAMDTEAGLFVPVIEKAEQKTTDELRTVVNEYKKLTVSRQMSQEKLHGHTFTLSNFGKFIGRYANPVVVPPTVAILGVGRLREAVAVKEGQPQVCRQLPLSLTFDHRAVTGGEATRFLALVMESLTQ